MKIKFLKTMFLLTLCTSLLTSCVGDDDYATPTVYEYAYTDGFETNWADWTKYSVTGAQTWQLDTQYGFNNSNCAKMSGYAGTNNVNEDWLISPAFDLSELTSAALTFKTASKFSGNVLEIKISSDYAGGNPNDATWMDLAATLDLDTSNYKWTGSGIIDISSFAGGNVYVAFKYTSTSSASTTWEVDDVKIIKN
ncbi:DUF5017 domain-containing protein [Flavobacterium sp. HXWNR69]|uniref:DUF5017 domain-containing protein n=1 Tax=Flavobacterium fragile TaxID=2949085 RepID=A0ABT0TET6_9FLAO|nr:choice-of-anchor J domain-containing protein [Flavobacterium sp. HXWNR69]MCL9769407.1 DUF5017 domain-containing protein [Flavobacterium sp. HXWNR69]